MPKVSVVVPVSVPSRFPVGGNPDVSVLQAFFDDPEAPIHAPKRAERLARSAKARQHRGEVKALKNTREIKDRPKVK